jgi:hypothetical protein
MGRLTGGNAVTERLRRKSPPPFDSVRCRRDGVASGLVTVGGIGDMRRSVPPRCPHAYSNPANRAQRYLAPRPATGFSVS